MEKIESWSNFRHHPLSFQGCIGFRTSGLSVFRTSPHPDYSCHGSYIRPLCVIFNLHTWQVMILTPTATFFGLWRVITAYKSDGLRTSTRARWLTGPQSHSKSLSPGNYFMEERMIHSRKIIRMASNAFIILNTSMIVPMPSIRH